MTWHREPTARVADAMRLHTLGLFSRIRAAFKEESRRRHTRCTLQQLRESPFCRIAGSFLLSQQCVLFQRIDSMQLEWIQWQIALFLWVLKCTTARVLRTLGPFWCAPCPAPAACLPRALCLVAAPRPREQIIANCFNYVAAGKMPQHVACCVLNCWRARRNFSFHCSAIVSCCCWGPWSGTSFWLRIFIQHSFCWCELQRTHTHRKVRGVRLLSLRNRPQCAIIYF